MAPTGAIIQYLSILLFNSLIPFVSRTISFTGHLFNIDPDNLGFFICSMDEPFTSLLMIGGESFNKSTQCSQLFIAIINKAGFAKSDHALKSSSEFIRDNLRIKNSGKAYLIILLQGINLIAIFGRMDINFTIDEHIIHRHCIGVTIITIHREDTMMPFNKEGLGLFC